MRRLVILLVVLLGANFRAYAFTIVERQEVKLAEMKSGEIYYSDRNFPFEDWKEGPEKQALNLFPGFRDGYGQSKVNVFVSKASFIIDRPATNIDVKKFLDTDLIQKLQKGLTDIEVTTQKDLELTTEEHRAYRNPPGPAWCAPDPNELCLKSRFVLDPASKVVLATYSAFSGKPDGEFRAESEVRALNIDQIKASGLNVQALTGIETDPSGAVVEDFFFFNHVLEFSKVLGVVQPHPGDPNKSIITTYGVFAVERKYWEDKRFVNVQDVILGKAHNREEGLMMGLPKVNQQLFTRLADWFTEP